MSLNYGFGKCKVVSDPVPKPSRHKQEIPYHLHATLGVPGSDGTAQNWDSAISVGANDTDDLLRYRLAFDYHNPILTTLKAAAAGFSDPEPVASLRKLLTTAHSTGVHVYIFGRTYTDGSPGIHDVHMNQGSSGSFLDNGQDDHNDHNDIWQDGAVLVDLGNPDQSSHSRFQSRQ